ncbi:helix-turn-helix domain-containing protein [Barnesiella viscericola]|uniref:helix-turn-helix domain-containing protein n=1 Tax=Barnesiella viscericola TaxID=397865 RepID=UPI0024B73F08|nr:winged helix-turn-helix domain-containing protein [Barnesiella viscericola]
MKPIAAIIVFFSLMLPSLFLSYGNYTTTKEYIINDVNQALAQTILYKTYDHITVDTLKVFRSKLQIDQLKETSYLSICTEEPSKIPFCSDTMSYKIGDERLHIRAYPNCSKAAIFGMSEQKLPSILFIISILWGLSSIMFFRMKPSEKVNNIIELETISVGALHFSKSSNLFFDEARKEIYFTPMQYQLMKMFIIAKNHRLSVEEICHSLWPGKEDARDTLYTLVRRIKPVLERACNVKIEAEKGHFYVLKTKER